MGTGPSTEEGQGASGHPTHGWRILQVVDGSPCAEKGLVVHFDFIIGCNGTRVDTVNNPLFPRGVAQFAGKEISLTIYNFKSQKQREVTIVPSKEWGGGNNGYLGMIVVFDSFMRADEDCIHIETVHPNSPASRAGLIPHEDYFLGTPELIIKGYDELDYIVNQNMRQPVEVYVFNAKTNSVRVVTITPDDEWSGDGSLGCDTSHGFLHRIPSNTTPVHMSNVRTSTAAAPVVASDEAHAQSQPVIENVHRTKNEQQDVLKSPTDNSGDQNIPSTPNDAQSSTIDTHSAHDTTLPNTSTSSTQQEHDDTDVTHAENTKVLEEVNLSESYSEVKIEAETETTEQNAADGGGVSVVVTDVDVATGKQTVLVSPDGAKERSVELP